MALSSQDVHEIQNLYAAYNYAIDFGDAAAFAECFSNDGVLDPGMGDPTEGQEALHAFAEATHSMLPGGRHLVTNLHLTGDEAGAVGRCYLQMWNTAGGSGSTSLIISGLYTDSLSKTSGAWRFDRRALTADA